ncbi:GNAT family N-acetyltransferase [Gammaproteobacteria bacterium AB-CW1]|uniref:GNAT family N-acetyltransferase n=1 Tax=Natronospira elongata TaxID=3110268 RepID=A0AAP6MMQ8_9GAMM|nr:GNAT family N-acetyltransferase [Gammaproteobacteria bacterium AB-CW1]
MVEIVKVSTETQIAAVARLAREIWVDHYAPIIGRAQVDYMLSNFQSEAAIARQLNEGQEYYLLRRDGQAAGYLALIAEPAEQRLKISKIYVDGRYRGQGLGRRLLAFTEEVCRERDLDMLWLTVNRDNLDSIRWYESMGFRNTGPVMFDIGGGYVMDDYRMEKQLSEPGTSHGARGSLLHGDE